MHYSLINKKSSQSATGFTLVEMLIIAPIVILAIGGFIALMVTMVGSVLSTRDQTTMTYQSQDALNRVEDDIRLSAQFLTTTGTLVSPQGSNDGTAAFTNASNTLILYTLATTKNPSDSSRELVYYENQPNACGAQQTFNQVLINKIIYYIKNGSLWRRTVMPAYNTNATPDTETVCTAPWQQDSCSPGYSIATRCKTNDIELMKNVSTLDVKYYSNSSSTVDLTAAGAAAASSVKVTVSGSKNSAGHTVGTTQSTRATRLNVSVQPPTIIPLQFTQHPADKAVIHTDTNVAFSASASLARATFQWERSINNGAFLPVAGATSATYTLPTVNLGMTGDRYRAVATADNETVTSNPATLTVTIWGDMDFGPGFSNFQDTYSINNYSWLGYTRTTAGVVMLKGMVKKSTAIAAGDLIGTLPAGSRPSGTLIFQTSSANASSRVDVNALGEIRVQVGNAGWVSLEGINFIPAGTSYTRNPLTLVNSWVDYGGSFPTPTYVMDSVGRVNVQGLVKNGTITDNTQIVNNLPASARTGEYLHLPSRNSAFGLIGISPTTGIVAKGTGTNNYTTLNSLYYPASFGSWTNLALQYGWVTYSAGFASPQYAKGADNIVRLKGLVRAGTTTDGTVIANLPAGYRPKDGSRALIGTVCNPNVYCRIDVLPNGNVELYFSNNGWTSLDSVTFLAEQ